MLYKKFYIYKTFLILYANFNNLYKYIDYKINNNKYSYFTL